MLGGLHVHYTRITSVETHICYNTQVGIIIEKGRAQGQGGALDNWYFLLGFMMCIYRRTKLRWRKYMTMFGTLIIVFIL